MIDRREFLGGLATLALAPWRAVGSPPDREVPRADERIGRVLESIRTGKGKLPGMIAAVVRGEGPTTIGVSGVRKIGSPVPVGVGDQFHLGSCTKAMTATMIGTLVDEGKLDWGSTLEAVFPGPAREFHADFRRVTLGQLLSHRGGLPANVSWWTLGVGLPVARKRRALLTTVLRKPPEAPPGTKFEYSNVGYVLAALMAEEVAKSSWEDLMARRLFGPLGMTSAGFGPPGRPGGVDQPWGHLGEGDALKPARIDNPEVMGPAGTVHGSMLDWARFATLHLRGVVDGRRLLKPETLRALHTPNPGEDYVGGWMTPERSWAGGRALTHGGSNTAWFCTIWVAPARDFALMAATNAGSERADEACDEAIGELIRIVAPDSSKK